MLRAVDVDRERRDFRVGLDCFLVRRLDQQIVEREAVRYVAIADGAREPGDEYRIFGASLLNLVVGEAIELAACDRTLPVDLEHAANGTERRRRRVDIRVRVVGNGAEADARGLVSG